MSVLDKFEKGVESAVNGVFNKFGSKDLQPVDLSSALEKEIDAQAMSVGRDRTVAPNEYRFALSTPDFDRIEKWGAETLANELAANLTKYAKTQNYAFVGPVVVVFEEDYDLPRSQFRLTSESVQGNAAPVTAKNETKDCPVLEINNRQYMLTAPVTLVGRGSDCDIIIDDPGVSRHHLTISITPQGVIMKEVLNAKGQPPVNGTYVEGHRVPAATLLDGNTITIGRTRILYWASSETQA
ncbi:FhaA domain-containing protein [Pseudoscardovia radai]|uniref:FhaA domain-containing protein n=1 Tax=Pseudoscardovia radai TaxID=987066 RepID=UPI00399666D7